MKFYKCFYQGAQQNSSYLSSIPDPTKSTHIVTKADMN